MGILPTLLVLKGELFPTEIRATAAGLTTSIGMIALMANVKLFPIAVESLGFHNVVYFYAIIDALVAAWGFLTINNIDELSLVEIEDMYQKTEASGKRKCDHPEEEVRKEGNYDGRGATYSVANAILNELGNFINVPKRKKISRVLNPPK